MHGSKLLGGCALVSSVRNYLEIAFMAPNWKVAVARREKRSFIYACFLRMLACIFICLSTNVPVTIPLNPFGFSYNWVEEPICCVHFPNIQFSQQMSCKTEFDPQWTDKECSLFKPLHDLQDMHLKLTKHGRFCKQNNQLPTKSHDELKDTTTPKCKFFL